MSASLVSVQTSLGAGRGVHASMVGVQVGDTVVTALFTLIGGGSYFYYTKYASATQYSHTGGWFGTRSGQFIGGGAGDVTGGADVRFGARTIVANDITDTDGQGTLSEIGYTDSGSAIGLPFALVTWIYRGMPAIASGGSTEQNRDNDATAGTYTTTETTAAVLTNKQLYFALGANNVQPLNGSAVHHSLSISEDHSATTGFTDINLGGLSWSTTVGARAADAAFRAVYTRLNGVGLDATSVVFSHTNAGANINPTNEDGMDSYSNHLLLTFVNPIPLPTTVGGWGWHGGAGHWAWRG